MDEAAILARFLDRYRADLEGSGVRSLLHYQALFPGFEDLIAREYADITRSCDEDASRPAEDSREAD